MPLIDPRIDAYIEKKAAFAKPILKHLRQLVHKTCPDASETIKWGMPFFDYKGSTLLMKRRLNFRQGRKPLQLT